MPSRGRLLGFLFLIIVIFTALAVPLVWQLNKEVTAKFEGNRWQLPARVYARAQDLFVGEDFTATQLESLLGELGFISDQQVDQPGEYSRGSQSLRFMSRSFRFPDEHQTSRLIDIRFSGGRIIDIRDGGSGETLPLFRLEPVRIANIYPTHNEDRVLVKLEEVPPLLLQSLLAVEDQDFYQHWGVQPKSIVRAIIANLRAGRTVQGGSTLTQQLVKNFFLSNERSLHRKVNEAVMSLLLEYHYDKDEILEAYLNEVFMGQDGSRAIHGFGLAAQFYFQRDVAELDETQIALLVGLVKGASYYDPRRRPERALERRNVVLDALVAEGVLESTLVDGLKQRSLAVTPKAPSGVTAYPAFLDLVRKQLASHYREEDLQNEGLIVFTTFNTLLQKQLESSVDHGLNKIETARNIEPNSLQAAMMLASVEQGEVLAMTGGRDPRYAGFNRALNMRRQIGSVVKPAVYLAALKQPQRYNLLSLMDDSELSMTQLDGSEWTPQNYDKTFKGPMTIMNSLVQSRNVPTIRLGEAVGVDNVIDTLRDLGVTSDLNPYPSLFLGAAELAPFEVLQMYQTIAAEGYRTPLRAISSVQNQTGDTLQRYPLEVVQAVPANADFLLTTVLHEVSVNGTARALQWLLPKGMHVAGKTGTTNDLRDSWFAGFSGEHVAVSWIGRDDYETTGLTGSSGALRLFGELFAGLNTNALQPLHPDDVEWAVGDPQSGFLTDQYCGGVWVPFIANSPRPEYLDCAVLQQFVLPEEQGDGVLLEPQPSPQNGDQNRLRELFQGLLH